LIFTIQALNIHGYSILYRIRIWERPVYSGSGIRNRFFPDLCKKIFPHQFKNKIIYNFVIKARTTNFSPISFVAVFGSGIRDPRSEIQNPGSRIRDGQKSGSGINILDPKDSQYKYRH
jgi:hypothetical protein